MKRYILIILILLSPLTAFLQADNLTSPLISIVPRPTQIVPGRGNFTFSAQTVFAVESQEQAVIARNFIDLFTRAAGITPALNVGREEGQVRFVTDSSLKSEAYLLEITPEQILIKASDTKGFFYALQSIRQLLPAAIESEQPVRNVDWRVPAMTVQDEPRFGFRGLLLDPVRCFIPKKNVLRIIDCMAMLKINKLHFHLTDDNGWRIEIKKYPRLTEVGAWRVDRTDVPFHSRRNPKRGELTPIGGFYTQEEIREIVAYAADRQIEVIPEIDVPAHSNAALAAYPQFACPVVKDFVGVLPGLGGRNSEIIYCAGNDSVFTFLQDVFDEILELFPSRYIHVGGDEARKTNWEKCPLCQARIRKEGLKGDKEHSAEEKLQSYFVQRMEKVVNKHGKKMIGWDEILEGGLAPSATVMSWRGEEGGIAAASMNHDVIMTPGSEGMYIDQFQGDYKINPVSIGGFTTAERVYKYNPVPDTLAAAGKGHFIKGVQCNVWSEYLYNTDIMEYRIYPRILALSEIAWSPLDRKDYKDFERRLDNAQVRLDGHGINYYIPQPEQPNGSCNFVAFTDKATMTFTTNRPMKMVYTLDGTEPTPESTVYTAPFDITETTTVKIASVLPSGKMGKPRTILVEKQTLAPAKEVAKTTPGLDMEVFDGMYLSVNNLEAAQKTGKKQVIKTTRELTNQVPAPESMRGVKQYAAIATGYVNIPEDGVYYISSDLEEVWIDGKLMVNNGGEVKRFSRHDTSAALAKGLHEIKLVFLGHIIGGWPSNWNDGSVQLRKSDAEKFTPITAEMLSH